MLRRRREAALAAGEIVFAFDIGDHADRKRTETEGTLGLTNAALLRQVRYDAITYGNNEGLGLPQAQWSRLANEAETPVLIANLFDLTTRIPLFDPYAIYEQQGVRVAVIGLTVPFFDFYNMYGIHAESPQETLDRVLPEVRAQEPDLVVLLSHLGLSTDQELAAHYDIDLILGGHTHQILTEPEHVNGTWIAQAGSHSRCLGHLELDWDDTARRLRHVSGGAIPRDDSTQPDADLLDLFQHWQEQAEEHMSEVVGTLPEELGHALAGNSPLAHALLDRMCRHSGTDIALINGGMFNHGLLAGAVTKRDLLTCFPSPNVTCVTDMTGAQILRALTRSIDPAVIERTGFGYGFRGHFIGGLQVAGLQIIVDEQGVHATHHGRPLELETVYRVATCDYLFFSNAFEEIKHGQHVRFDLPFLRELLEDVIRTGEYEHAPAPRWQFNDREEPHHA